MIPQELFRYLEAAYLYYLHPEEDPLMSDHEWDALGRELEERGLIKETGSLFQMREQDYPETIRNKYAK